MSLLAHVSRIVRDAYDHWRHPETALPQTGPYRVIRVIDGDYALSAYGWNCRTSAPDWD